MKKEIRIIVPAADLAGPWGCNARTAVRRLKKFNKRKGEEIGFQDTPGGPWYANVALLKKYALFPEDEAPKPAQEATLLDVRDDVIDARTAAQKNGKKLDLVIALLGKSDARGCAP